MKNNQIKSINFGKTISSDSPSSFRVDLVGKILLLTIIMQFETFKSIIVSVNIIFYDNKGQTDDAIHFSKIKLTIN